ncbi:hypothetical protein [Alienimonas californiensis]|uniref:Uncharacterized protein n=1 Tax=Alienimonas californiensis TaxID=2527989 RepID=A0A517P8U4_9PLAN|nr:hypothetical protein [Alienimonas californiensis]QDT15803.1 hypothetical protein CA12_18970 [Alienimonas californiensis]
MPAFPSAPDPGPAPPTEPPDRQGPGPHGGPHGDREPPPQWALRTLDRLGWRWWMVTAALLPLVAGGTAFGLSVAGMANLVRSGLPPAELLTAEIPRAITLCLWPGIAACGLVVYTAPAWSARPFAVLCAAAAAALTLRAGAIDLTMTLEGRGKGAAGFYDVWPLPAALGLLAFILWQEHRHGRHTVREEEANGPTLRVWTPDE